MDFSSLSKLKIKKKFDRHNHATYVHLLENGIIKKKYPEKYRRYFLREIYMMQYLQKCKNVVNLIHADYDNLILYMTYGGKRMEGTGENKMKVQEVAKKLHKKWGLVRINKDKVTYNIFILNTGIMKDNRIMFFDLPSKKWHIEQNHPKFLKYINKIEDPKEVERVKRILK